MEDIACGRGLVEFASAGRKADVMTTSPNGPIPATPSPDRVPLRILLDNGPESGPLDGAWWPQSRDLQVEAADLIDHFPLEVGRVDRLLYSPPDWDAGTGASGTHRVHTARGVVKVGSFPHDDTHLMVLRMSSRRSLRLLVVPSTTEPFAAMHLMQRAADRDNHQPAGALLTQPEV